jgi:hypothetical protein
MLRKLFQPSRADGQESFTFPSDGFVKGEVLPLPLGAVVAEQGVRFLKLQAGRLAQPVLDEAYVVMRLYDQSCWYATWEPYAGGWSLLRLDAEAEAGPAPNDLDLPLSASAPSRRKRHS